MAFGWSLASLVSRCRRLASADYVDTPNLLKTDKLCDNLITAFASFQAVSHMLLACYP